MMRFGFYYHIPVVQMDNGIFMPGYLGRFIDALADHFDSLVLFMHPPNINENVNLDYRINSCNVDLVSLPTRGSVPHRFFRSSQYTQIIKNHLSSLDALMVRGPSPLLPAILRKAENMPTILLLVGDYLAGVDTLQQPWWRKNLIRLWAWINEQRQLSSMTKSLVFVNSQKLYNKYEGRIDHLFHTRTTTLSKVDFFPRKDTCKERPTHLLYTGRMDPAKGLLDMVAALGILAREGEDIVLDLVGWAEAGSDILSQMKAEAGRLGVGDRLLFHGYKAVGPELFAYYKGADIYLIASQSSFEGFPRTIWEAMAHSLPVVATVVGSIPDFVAGAAVLVPPRDPHALAEGLRRLIHDPELRKTHIKKGFYLAQRNTLEVQVEEMVQRIKDWMKKKDG